MVIMKLEGDSDEWPATKLEMAVRVLTGFIFVFSTFGGLFAVLWGKDLRAVFSVMDHPGLLVPSLWASVSREVFGCDIAEHTSYPFGRAMLSSLGDGA